MTMTLDQCSCSDKLDAETEAECLDSLIVLRCVCFMLIYRMPILHTHPTPLGMYCSFVVEI